MNLSFQSSSLQIMPARCGKGDRGEAGLTFGNPHVGSHLEPGVNVNHCAPHHIAAEVSWDKLHGGRQVVSGLVALVRVVICVVMCNMCDSMGGVETDLLFFRLKNG